MTNDVTFNESAWTIIENLLPDDVFLKGVVLEDFMWFMGRSKKFKNSKEKIKAYIRHLELKAKPAFDVRPNQTMCFKSINIERVKEELHNQFKSQ